MDGGVEKEPADSGDTADRGRAGSDGNGEALRGSRRALPEYSGGPIGEGTQRRARTRGGHGGGGPGPARPASLREGGRFLYRAIQSRGADSPGPGHGAADRGALPIRQRTAGHPGHGQDGEGRAGECCAILFGERHAGLQLRHGRGRGVRDRSLAAGRRPHRQPALARQAARAGAGTAHRGQQLSRRGQWRIYHVPGREGGVALQGGHTRPVDLLLHGAQVDPGRGNGKLEDREVKGKQARGRQPGGQAWLAILADTIGCPTTSYVGEKTGTVHEEWDSPQGVYRFTLRRVLAGDWNPPTCATIARSPSGTEAGTCTAIW